MKRIVITFGLLISVFCGLDAITQAGYVKTRGLIDSKGRHIIGKRLGNATIVLQSGSSAQANGSGDFELELPGNSFYLKNVKKVGYVVADPDALSKQYVYSSNPLILTLDKLEDQQKDELATEKRLRENAEKELKRRKAEVERLKKENQLSQKQYSEALQKIQADCENNEKFIAEMAERYSRIDFDLLDDFQRRFAAYVQNGEFVRADSLLRTKGSMDDREAELIRLRNANAKEREELVSRQENLFKSEKNEAVMLAEFAADCYNHFELCKLKFDNDSAAYWLEKRANLLPENIEYQLEAGGFICDYLANYSLSSDYYNRALNSAIDQYGENHPDVATSYNNIGSVYSSQGNYAGALENYEKALKIRLGIFGENHPYVAISYNNIGFVYSSLGDYPHALENFEKALKIWFGIFGENYPDVATSYNNIGYVYSRQGDYDVALENYEKALKIRLGIFGENHPDVAGSYNNIGRAYDNQGDYSRALENYEKALKIWLGIFGENHPDVARSYNNIGSVYDSQGNYDVALENYEKALKIWLGLFGENHPYVATSYNNIGSVYSSQGNYDVALENYEKALKIRLGIFGENHPDVATSYNNIGFVYFSQGDYDVALDNFEKALKISLGIFGEHHPDVKTVKIGIAYVKNKMEEQKQ